MNIKLEKILEDFKKTWNMTNEEEICKACENVSNSIELLVKSEEISKTEIQNFRNEIKTIAISHPYYRIDLLEVESEEIEESK